MPSFATKDFGFVHMPKTGGWWVFRSVCAMGIHMTQSTPMDDLHKGIDWIEADLPVLAFIRSPFEWFPSLYAYHVRFDWEIRPDMRGATWPEFFNATFGEYRYWIKHLLGDPISPRVTLYAYEHLEEVVARWLTQSGYPGHRVCQVEPENVSQVKPLLDATQVTRIAFDYGDVIELHRKLKQRIGIGDRYGKEPNEQRPAGQESLASGR